MIALLLLLNSTIQAPVPQVTPVLDPTFHSPDTLQLSYIRGLLPLPHGDVLLLEGRGTTVWRLDSLGRVLHSVARFGAGPGEVKAASTMGLLGDTLWISDVALRRVTYYSPLLKVLRTERFEQRCAGWDPWALLPRGRCLVVPQPGLAPSQPDPAFWPALSVGLDHSVDTLGRLVLPRMRIRYPDAVSHVRQPFADDPVLLVSFDGRFLAWAPRRPEGTRTPASLRIDFADFATGHRRTFQVNYTPQRLPRDTAAKALRALTAHQPPWPGLTDSIAHRLYRPTYLPAFQQSLLDQAGHLWLLFPTPRGTPIWHVFTTVGVECLAVTLPAGFHLVARAGSRLLGYTRDQDDVPAIVQYRLPLTEPVQSCLTTASS